MSNLQYFEYEGFGARVRVDTHYSQAVRIDNRIEISGQGGWDRQTEKFSSDVNEEMAQAFANVEHTLQRAGGKGWEQVYKVRAFITPGWEINAPVLVENLRKYCPNHQPLLTAVVVHKLFDENMHIELEVEAYLG